MRSGHAAVDEGADDFNLAVAVLKGASEQGKLFKDAAARRPWRGPRLLEEPSRAPRRAGCTVWLSVSSAARKASAASSPSPVARGDGGGRGGSAAAAATATAAAAAATFSEPSATTSQRPEYQQKQQSSSSSLGADAGSMNVVTPAFPFSAISLKWPNGCTVLADLKEGVARRLALQLCHLLLLVPEGAATRRRRSAMGPREERPLPWTRVPTTSNWVVAVRRGVGAGQVHDRGGTEAVEGVLGRRCSAELLAEEGCNQVHPLCQARLGKPPPIPGLLRSLAATAVASATAAAGAAAAAAAAATFSEPSATTSPAAGVPAEAAVVVVVVVVAWRRCRQHERGRTGLPLQRHFKWPNGCFTVLADLEDVAKRRLALRHPSWS